MPCALSGANEVAVQLFLQGKIKYTQIASYVKFALEKVVNMPVTYQNLVYTDGFARECVMLAFKEKKFD